MSQPTAPGQPGGFFTGRHMTDEVERLRISWERAKASKKRARDRVRALEDAIDGACAKCDAAELRHEKAYNAYCEARAAAHEASQQHKPDTGAT